MAADPLDVGTPVATSSPSFGPADGAFAARTRSEMWYGN